MPRARFGAVRLVRDDQGAGARLLYRVLGVADPAHWLHFRYCERALDRFAPPAPRAILDAGSERGDFTVYLAQRFPRSEVEGIDNNPAHHANAIRYSAPLALPNLRYVLGDLTRLDAPGRYDLVVCIDVLEHIPAQDDVLRRLRGALAPGGVAFFHLPTRRPVPPPLARHLRDFHRWAEGEHLAEERTAEEVAEAVRRAGFELLEVRRTFGFWAGELATSLFDLPYRNTPVNRILQALLAPVCRVLALADAWYPGRARFAVAVVARAPEGVRPG